MMPADFDGPPATADLPDRIPCDECGHWPLVTLYRPEWDGDVDAVPHCPSCGWEP